MDDLRLYMDTHPEDQEGLKLLKDMLKRRKTLLKAFAVSDKYYEDMSKDCSADYQPVWRTGWCIGGFLALSVAALYHAG